MIIYFFQQHTTDSRAEFGYPSIRLLFNAMKIMHFWKRINNFTEIAFYEIDVAEIRERYVPPSNLHIQNTELHDEKLIKYRWFTHSSYSLAKYYSHFQNSNHRATQSSGRKIVY